MSLRTTLALTAALALIPAGTAAAGPLDALKQLRPNLITGVKVSPGRVPVDTAGIPVGASLSFRLSKPADVSFQVLDTSGRKVADGLWAVPSPYGTALLSAGAQRVPIVAPGSPFSGTPQFSLLGALRPGKMYILIAYAGFCGDCSSRTAPVPSYTGLPQVTLFRTGGTVTPPPAT